jgi:hypothetical protein
MNFVLPVFMSLVAISSSLSCDEIHLYNSMKESIIAPSDLESAEFYLNRGDFFYETNHFDMAMIAYNRACELVLPSGSDIQVDAENLSTTSLITFCDAFRGRLRCYLAQGNDADMFWLSQSELLFEIDPRMPQFESHGDTLIVRTKETFSDEDLEIMKEITKNDSITRINETDFMIRDSLNRDCCSGCAAGDGCEDELGRIEFEQNIEKKSSN